MPENMEANVSAVIMNYTSTVKIRKPKIKDISIVKISNKSKVEFDLTPGLDKKCIWPLDDNHWGDTQEVDIFQAAGGLKVYICEAHIEWHMAIIALFRAGMDIDRIFDLTKNDCLRMAARLLVPIVEL